MIEKILGHIEQNLVKNDTIVNGYSDLAKAMLNHKKRNMEHILAEALSNIGVKIFPEDIEGWKIVHKNKYVKQYEQKFDLMPMLFALYLPEQKYLAFLKKNRIGDSIAIYLSRAFFDKYNTYAPLYFNIFGLALFREMSKVNYYHESLHQARYFYSRAWKFFKNFEKTDNIDLIKLKVESTLFDEITAYCLSSNNKKYVLDVLIDEKSYLSEIKKECYSLKKWNKKVKLQLRKYFMSLKKCLPEVVDASYYLKSCLPLKYLSKVYLSVEPTWQECALNKYDSIFDEVLWLADNVSKKKLTVDKIVKLIREKGY